MSAGGPGRREVAHRLFAAEYDDASLEYAESDEERAPNYVVTPSGARVNRIFVVGVLTSVEEVNEDTVRARIADPTGAFVVYAGQYQPDELAALQSIESPAFVAVTGKANTFEPEGSDRVLTSVRPESVTEVDAETRDRWVVTTAEHTLARIQAMADALGREQRGEELRTQLVGEGIEPGVAEGIAKAIDHYGTTPDYLGALQELTLQSVEVVAGERQEAEALEVAPDEEDGSYAAGDLTGLVDEETAALTEAAGDVAPEALAEDSGVAEAEDAATEEVESEPTADPSSESSTESSAEPSADSSADSSADPDEDAETDTAADTEASSAGTSAHDAAADVTTDTDDVTAATESTSTEADATSVDEEPESADADAPEDSAASEAEPSPDSAADDADEPAADAEREEGMYEVDEEEREQIEEEYGVGFQSGTEVEEPGEADIDVEPEEPPAEADDGDVATGEDADDGASEAQQEAEDDEDAGEAPEDLEDALLEEMESLDDGGGADREALVEAVVDATGADPDAVDDAIDDALMSGKCYEPSEGKLTPI